jgi:hypothetical protein
MKRRQRPKIALVEAPEPGPVRPHEIAAAMAALQPPATSAHDTADPCPCEVCGGPADRSEVHWGPWRTHRACAPLRGDPIGRLVAASTALGRHLERQDAALVPFNAPRYADTHPEPVWDTEPLRERLPWRHLDRDKLYAAIERLPELRVEAGLIERPSEWGACAWCGRAESKNWADRGHHWRNGDPAGLCEGCAAIYDRAGEPDPTYWPDQRAAIAEACSGVPSMMGYSPPEILAYAETELDSDGEPWGHLPSAALESFRWAQWGRWGGRYAPAEHRAEALARAAAAEEAKMARMAEKRAEEAARLDVFGFGFAR